MEGDMLLTPLLLLLALSPEETRALMQRVAENLEKASAARSNYIYMQSSHARLLRSKSKVAREEKRTYRVTPQPGRTEFLLTSFAGTYWKGKEPIPYNSPDFRVKDMDLDGELLEDFAADHIARPNSKDGIGFQQFALRKQDIADYHFHLLREERVDGRKAVTIRLEPRVKDWDHLWSGEATIDLEDEFPIRLASEMNRKLP
jgi:hypothetical protein